MSKKELYEKQLEVIQAKIEKLAAKEALKADKKANSIWYLDGEKWIFGVNYSEKNTFGVKFENNESILIGYIPESITKMPTCFKTHVNDTLKKNGFQGVRGEYMLYRKA
jgi:hypothetical protein